MLYFFGEVIFGVMTNEYLTPGVLVCLTPGLLVLLDPWSYDK